MGYFPICMDMSGRRVLCVGEGRAIADKAARLREYGCRVEEVRTLAEDELGERPALVVVGGMDREAAAGIAEMCMRMDVPVNVVDMPEMCSCIFPALIRRGDVTISITTGGRSPALAARLRRRIERWLPERLEEIVEWLAGLRQALPRELPNRKEALGRAAESALDVGRPLSEGELCAAIEGVREGERAGKRAEERVEAQAEEQAEERAEAAAQGANEEGNG